MRAREVCEQLSIEARRILVGQEEAFELLLVALLAGGHVLIEGVPGTAKTLMAKTLAMLIGGVEIDDGIVNYITSIAQKSRRSTDLVLGASTRASITLLLGSKVLAALRGRNYVIPDDVKYLAPAAYRHRLILRPEAEIEGLDADAVVTKLLAGVAVPR